VDVASVKHLVNQLVKHLVPLVIKDVSKINEQHMLLFLTLIRKEHNDS